MSSKHGYRFLCDPLLLVALAIVSLSILYIVLGFIPLPTTSLNINVLEEYVKAFACLNKSSVVVRSLASFTYNPGVGVEKVLKSVRDRNKVLSTL